MAKSELKGWPAEFTLTDALALFAKERGFNPLDAFEEFRDWAAANDAKYKDWPAAFRHRLRNQIRWRGEKKPAIGFVRPQNESPSIGHVRREIEAAAAEVEAEFEGLSPEERTAKMRSNLRRLSEIYRSTKK